MYIYSFCKLFLELFESDCLPFWGSWKRQAVYLHDPVDTVKRIFRFAEAGGTVLNIWIPSREEFYSGFYDKRPQLREDFVHLLDKRIVNLLFRNGIVVYVAALN